MKLEDYLKGEMSAARHCPVRRLCPLGCLCGVGDDDDDRSSLMPRFVDVKQSDFLWVDLRHEQRVFVVKSGVIVCLANLDAENEIPFAVCGAGAQAGMAELYITRDLANTYYYRALTDAVLCSFPAKPVRRHLEALPTSLAQGIMATTLINVSTASYIQTKILTRPLIYDRLVMFFLHLRELYARGGSELGEINLTHGEIATLVSSDRVSTARALHKMEDDGLIELGYKTVRFKEGLDEMDGLRAEVHQFFHVPALEEEPSTAL